MLIFEIIYSRLNTYLQKIDFKHAAMDDIEQRYSLDFFILSVEALFFIRLVCIGPPHPHPLVQPINFYTPSHLVEQINCYTPPLVD